MWLFSPFLLLPSTSVLCKSDLFFHDSKLEGIFILARDYKILLLVFPSLWLWAIHSMRLWHHVKNPDKQGKQVIKAMIETQRGECLKTKYLSRENEEHRVGLMASIIHISTSINQGFLQLSPEQFDTIDIFIFISTLPLTHTHTCAHMHSHAQHNQKNSASSEA